MQDKTSHTTPAKNQTKPWRIELVNHPWHAPAEPFHVELRRDAIDDLIADARQAHRAYELMMIRRPGDVWKYLWVRMLEVPQAVAGSVAWRRKEKSSLLRSWPEDCIPLTEFDACFSWAWDDTTPESQTWLTHRGSKTFKKVADALLAEVTQAQDELRNCDDPLIEAEIEAMKTNSHFHDHDALAPHVLTPPGHVSITAPKQMQGYYQKLREVVARADVRIVSAYNHSDFQTLRIICAEQRRRARRASMRCSAPKRDDGGRHSFQPLGNVLSRLAGGHRHGGCAHRLRHTFHATETIRRKSRHSKMWWVSPHVNTSYGSRRSSRLEAHGGPGLGALRRCAPGTW